MELDLKPRYICLGDTVFDTHTNTLRRGGKVISLESKWSECLFMLSDPVDNVVTRRLFLDTVWANTVVTDYALSRCISQLRRVFKLLGETRVNIKVIHKTGYTLVISEQCAQPIDTDLTSGANLNSMESKESPDDLSSQLLNKASKATKVPDISTGSGRKINVDFNKKKQLELKSYKAITLPIGLFIFALLSLMTSINGDTAESNTSTLSILVPLSLCTANETFLEPTPSQECLTYTILKGCSPPFAMKENISHADLELNDITILRQARRVSSNELKNSTKLSIINSALDTCR